MPSHTVAQGAGSLLTFSDMLTFHKTGVVSTFGSGGHPVKDTDKIGH